MWIFCQILWKTYTPVLTECRSFPPLERKESFRCLEVAGVQNKTAIGFIKSKHKSKNRHFSQRNFVGVTITVHTEQMKRITPVAFIPFVFI